jgi:hypothetical protein
MAEKKENIITHSMHSGLILGGLIVVRDFLSLVVFNGNVFMLLLLGLVGFVIPFFCIFHFTKKFDREVLKGKISYLNALSYGFYMFFFAAMIIALFSFIYFQYVNPDYLAQQGDAFINILKQLSFPKEIVKKYEDVLTGVQTPTAAGAAISGLWAFTFSGFIICLFTSLFFRKRKNNAE